MFDFEKLKEMKMQTTDIKGKDYVQVNERVKAFRMLCPEGTILTELISDINGVCTIKASIYDGDRLLATGYAQEKETSSYINKTSYVENCVPLTTQILTAEGWKFFYQLKEGEQVLSLNLDTKQTEYCRLERINVYEKQPLLELSTSRFKAVCTPLHKWVTRTQYRGLEKTPTNEMKVSQKIVQAVPMDVHPSKLGRMLGWLMCDCDMVYAKGMASTAYISQAKHMADVEELFGEGRVVKKYGTSWLDCKEWVVSAEKVREILGAFGMATYKDLPKAMLTAPIEDVKGCFDSVMLADGESRGFSSTYPELIEAMQIMCARLGLATGILRRRMCNLSTKPIYTLPIKKTDGAWFSEMKVRNIPPADVWCPTTENGTWFMRQDGFVTLTSNCETSAIGRALGFCGIGIDVSIATAEEVETAINNQERIKAEEKQIGATKAKALRAMFETEGILEAFILDVCGISKLEELTEGRHRWITNNIKSVKEKQNRWSARAE